MPDQVSRNSGYTTHGEMGIVGYLLAAAVALLLLPVLPFLAVVWLFRKLGGNGGAGGRRATPG